jgi:tRNA(Ile2) C34 agmatinyltransferase TiaS
MENQTQSATPIASHDLFCPDCGREAEQDHNSFQCHRCEKLWPKGAGWEVRSAVVEIAELRLALRNVMAAVGMFETHPIPAMGRCGECYGTTIAPGVHKCRNCAKESALKLLGQNSSNS